MLKDDLAQTVLAKEMLRREHNRRGALVRSGQMPDAVFRKYVDEEFEPAMEAIADRQFEIEATIISAALGPE